MCTPESVQQKRIGRNFAFALLVSAGLHLALLAAVSNGRPIAYGGSEESVWQLIVSLPGVSKSSVSAVKLPSLATVFVLKQIPSKSLSANAQMQQTDALTSEMVPGVQPAAEYANQALIPLEDITPIYPMSERHARVSGYVILDIQLAEDGSVRTMDIVEIYPSWVFQFGQAALEAFSKARFRVHGNPDYVYRVRVDFDPGQEVPNHSDIKDR